MEKPGILFDLDGTLWDVTAQSVAGYNEALQTLTGGARQITLPQMRSMMGKTIREFADILFPDLDLPMRTQYISACCEAEMARLRKYGGVLYPELETTLRTLQKDYRLFIVSNSSDGYVQFFLEFNHLEGYFEDFEMAGRTGKCKGENIRMVVARNGLQRALYMGDTAGDKQGAELAGLPFLYASYGFGSLEGEPYTAAAFSEVPALAAQIFAAP